ncbi:MAG: hypothetical protein OEV99_12850 [Nitrospira sp.]|nr:hypothetical protein [Nitrospira sp.]MDH4370716.1 hypothetical protein [Nitrospira sp.]MDH5347511.1 hypothetical protein [Nitrospira sp.]MDH5498412.1 hypothetical protein [Nitrospira sp.]MDH5724344.1 hypothetical protein [Nitrospira sp.]
MIATLPGVPFWSAISLIVVGRVYAHVHKTLRFPPATAWMNPRWCAHRCPAAAVAHQLDF